MQKYILQRFFQGLILLVLVTMVVFFLGRLTGNPVDMMLPEDATEEEREEMITAYKEANQAKHQEIKSKAKEVKEEIRALVETEATRTSDL